MLELLILSIIAGAAREITQQRSIMVVDVIGASRPNLGPVQVVRAATQFYDDAHALDSYLIEALS